MLTLTNNYSANEMGILFKNAANALVRYAQTGEERGVKNHVSTYLVSALANDAITHHDPDEIHDSCQQMCNTLGHAIASSLTDEQNAIAVSLMEHLVEDCFDWAQDTFADEQHDGVLRLRDNWGTVHDTTTQD